MSHMKNRDSNRIRREDRQVQAQIRQEAYDKLTVSQKLDLLGSTRALKQRAKLVKVLEKEVVEEERSLVAEVTEGVEALVKERKGVKAKRQARKDKRGA